MNMAHNDIILVEIGLFPDYIVYLRFAESPTYTIG